MRLMNLRYLPVDKTKPESLGGVDEFLRLTLLLDEDPNQISQWDELFAKIDQRISTVNTKDVSTEFKLFINGCYRALLRRFPYLVEYWRRFAVLEYKLNGMQASIAVLRDAVNACKYSLELWEDYLNALLLEKDPSYNQKLEECIKLNGYHFTSHSLWDKYLESKKLDDLLLVYLELTQIPLYDYAKYYNQFVEINKNFGLKLVLRDELESYLSKYGKSEESECSVIEVHQIIDDFSYHIFTKNQEWVNIKWEYESKLESASLDLKSLNTSENWVRYLDSEIENHKNDFKSIVNLFERALIPCCFDENLWLKYLAYLNVMGKTDEMELVYQRSINTFLPLLKNKVRHSYALFLAKQGKTKQMDQYMLELIQFYSGDNWMKLYFKDEYTQTVQKLLEIWSRSAENRQEMLNNILECYFGDSKIKEAKGVDTESLQKLFNLANDQAIALVMDVYLETLLELETTPEKAKQIRGIFNKYHTKPQLSCHTPFWRYFVEFEGISMYNFGNLSAIMNYIKSKATLPKKHINAFISLQYNLYISNYEQFKNQVNDATIINYHADVSLSAKNIPKPVREIRNQFEHPGIVEDSRPDISNTLLAQNFDLLADEIPYPAICKTDRAGTPSI